MVEKFQINLTADDILKKQFKTSRKGYDTEEVDKYLDTIIADYDSYRQAIKSLEKEVELLKSRVNQAQPTAIPSPAHSQQVQSQPAMSTEKSEFPATNYDIIQRVSKLESKVYRIEQYLNAQNAKNKN